MRLVSRGREEERERERAEREVPRSLSPPRSPPRPRRAGVSDRRDMVHGAERKLAGGPGREDAGARRAGDEWAERWSSGREGEHRRGPAKGEKEGARDGAVRENLKRREVIKMDVEDNTGREKSSNRR